MDFFDTVAGSTFVNYTIPELVSELKTINAKKKQFSKSVPKDKAAATIQAEAEKGCRYYDSIDLGNEVLIIFEKEAD